MNRSTNHKLFSFPFASSEFPAEPIGSRSCEPRRFTCLWLTLLLLMGGMGGRLQADIAWVFEVEFSSGSRAEGKFLSDGSESDLLGTGTLNLDPGLLLEFSWTGSTVFETAAFVGTSEFKNSRFTWDRDLQEVTSIWVGSPASGGYPLQWGSGASGTDLFQLQLTGSPSIRDGDGAPDSGYPAQVGSIVTLCLKPETISCDEPPLRWAFDVEFSSGVMASGVFESSGSASDLQGSGDVAFAAGDLVTFSWAGTTIFETADFVGASEYHGTQFTWDRDLEEVTGIWVGNSGNVGYPLQWGSGAPGTDLFQVQLSGSPSIRDQDGLPDSGNPSEVGAIVSVCIRPESGQCPPPLPEPLAWEFEVEFSSGSRATGRFDSNGVASDLEGSGVLDLLAGRLLEFEWVGVGAFETADFVGTLEFRSAGFTWDRDLEEVTAIWVGTPGNVGYPLQWGTGAPGTDLFQVQLSGSPSIRDHDGLPDSGDPSEVGSIVSLCIRPETMPCAPPPPPEPLAWYFEVEFSSGSRATGLFGSDGTESDLEGSGLLELAADQLLEFEWDGVGAFESADFVGTSEFRNAGFTWDRDLEEVTAIWVGTPGNVGHPLQWGDGAAGTDLFQLQLSGSPSIRDHDGLPDSGDPSEVGSIVSLCIRPASGQCPPPPPEPLAWYFEVEFSSGSHVTGVFDSNAVEADLSGTGLLELEANRLLGFEWDGVGAFETADFVGTTEFQGTGFTWDRDLQEVTGIWLGSPGNVGYPLQWGSGAAGTDLFQLQLFGSPSIRDHDGLPDSGDPAEVGSIVSLTLQPFVSFPSDRRLVMRFEEGAGLTTNDISIYGHVGQLREDVFFSTDVGCFLEQGQTTNNQYALAFDGAWDAVEIPDAASLQPVGALTVEALVQTDAVVEGGAIVGRQYGAVGTDAFRNSWQIGVSGGVLWFGVTDDQGVSGTIYHRVGFDDSEWRHLAGIWDTNSLQLYLDGVLVAVQPFSGSGTLGYLVSNPVLVGADDDGLGVGAVVPFTGLIDEVRVTSRALAPHELLMICGSGGGQ